MFHARTFKANASRESSYGAASGEDRPLSGLSKNTMPFEIKPINQEAFDAVYTPELTQQLMGFVHPTRDRFDLSRRSWAVDPGRDAYFLEVSLINGKDWSFSYLLIQGREFALVESEGHCRYSFVRLSPGFAWRPEEAESLVAQALRVGGVFLDGCYNLPPGFGMNLPNINAVPHAEFIPRKTHKVN